MIGRGTAAALLLLVVGVVGGYAAAYAFDPAPDTRGRSGPVVAVSPSVPVDPVPTLVAEPAVPALATDLPMGWGALGGGGFRVTFPVPERWTRIGSSTNEVKWKRPGNPANTYILRVGRLVSREKTPDEMVDERYVDLRDDKASFRVEARTANSLEFTYVSDGFLRHGFLVWLDVRATGFADVEIAVTGRGIDAPGAEELITRVASGMRQVV
jgi:hypothetical protein